MSKRHTNLDLREYKKKEMDSVSSSFCAAKWLYSIIWLYNGTTASCHHPHPHKIPLMDALRDPSNLHNTETKKKCREQMLEGSRPPECFYCWDVEDSKEESISDRTFKTVSFNLDSVRSLKDLDPQENINPEIIEIAFSRNCNLACAYCCPLFSTSWDKYNSSYSSPYAEGNSPYNKIFWRWLPKILNDLKLLRVTGGEPLLSKDFWNLFDWITIHKPSLNFSVNTNLCVSDALIDKLIEKGKKIDKFEVFTSCEATGIQAEYLRDGMYFDKFWYNCEKIISQTNLHHFCFIFTVNALSIFSLIDFMNKVEKLKVKFGHDHPNFFINILHHPPLMSVDILPKEIRFKQRDLLQAWYEERKDSPLFRVYELESLKGLIDYLGKEEESTIVMQSKFKTFFNNYDKERNKNLLEAFPLGDWYTRI